MRIKPEAFESAQQTEQSAIKRAEKREDTRSKIAERYIWGYIGIVILLVIMVTLAHLSGDASKDFLLAIGSPLGFIIGFYFKSTDKE